MKKRIHAKYSVFVFLPVLAVAQQATTPSQSPVPQAPPLTVRPADTPASDAAEGRIHLDVVVTDKAGKPESGLEFTDFTLLDNNQPDKILSFRASSGTAQKAGPPTAVILILDTVNGGPQTLALARQGIEAFLLQNGGHLAQPVSIFQFSLQGVKVLLQPSTDGSALAAGLKQVDAEVRAVGRSTGTNGEIERYQLSVHWLTLIARNVAKMPGRKLLIWVGPGWPMLNQARVETSFNSQKQLFDSIVDLSTTLREARTALYSLSIGDPHLGASLYEEFVKGVKMSEKASPPNLALDVLAAQSGGLVMDPSNDVAGEIDKCAEDASAFYSISFDPPRADRANEYHDLKVQIDRPGLTARTSTGYYNQP